jgi:hypothetical protein
MLHLEFAIAPSEISTIEQLSLIDARLGFEQGAVLSRFPSKWFKEVSDNLRNESDGTRLDRATEKLRSLKANKLVAFERRYEGDTWVDAARNSHQISPFHRLIESTLIAPPHLISSFDELNEDDFKFNTRFQRNASILASAAKALLSNAEKVTLYDPFLCLTKAGYKKTLLEMMHICTKGDVEFHIFSEEERKPPWEERLALLLAFRVELPDNIRFHWYCASDNGTGFLHPRGLFTAKGGLIYDRGFEEPRDLAQRAGLTDIYPMPKDMLEQKSISYNTAQQYSDFNLVREVWFSHDC